MIGPTAKPLYPVDIVVFVVIVLLFIKIEPVVIVPPEVIELLDPVIYKLPVIVVAPTIVKTLPPAGESLEIENKLPELPLNINVPPLAVVAVIVIV